MGETALWSQQLPVRIGIKRGGGSDKSNRLRDHFQEKGRVTFGQTGCGGGNDMREGGGRMQV